MASTDELSWPSTGLRAFLDAADGPAATLAPAQPIATRELFVDRRQRGQASPRLVHEGGVLFLRMTSFRLTVDDLASMARRSADLRRQRIELVKFAFMLCELPPGWRYAEVRVRITVKPQVPVMQLRPQLKNAESQSVRTVTSEFTPTLARLLQFEMTHTRTTSTSRTEQRPVVTAVDLGPDGFGWTYQAQDGAPLLPRLEHTVAVLELPPDATELNGLFDAEAIIARRLLGTFESKRSMPAEPPVPFRVALSSDERC